MWQVEVGRAEGFMHCNEENEQAWADVCLRNRQQMAMTLVNSPWPQGKAMPQRLPPWQRPHLHHLAV